MRYTGIGIVVLFLLSEVVMPQMLASTNEDVHVGTLVIDGREYVIENKTFTQYGDIIVRNGGKLIIRNSIFKFKIDYHEQYSIRIEDNSEIIVENSAIYPVGDGDVFGILFRDSSKGHIKNMSQGEKNFGTTIILETGSPSINIENSQLTMIEISKGLNRAMINISNSQIESWGLWISSGVLKDLGVGYIHDTVMDLPNCQVHLSNVSITKEVIIWTFDNSEIWIYNSKISQIDVRESSRVHLVNSTVWEIIPFLSDREFGVDNSISLTLHSDFYKNYTLNFTQMGGWCIELINTYVGCPPVDYLPPGGWYVKIGPGVNVSIFDSDIDRLRFSTFHGNATVYVRDSVIHWFEFWDFNGIVTLDNVTITEWFSVYKEPEMPQKALIKGNVTIVPKSLQFMFGLKWYNSTIEREYPVNFERGPFYTAYNNFSIRILSPEGNIVYSSQVTPSETQYPIITFDKHTYNKIFLMEAWGDDKLLSTYSIDLLTSTPIKVSLGDNLPLDKITSAPLVYGYNRVDKEYGQELWSTMYPDSKFSNKSTKIITLIGGPVANNLTKRYMKYFPIQVTNTYPGRGKGVIETAVINGKIYILLAGSDRWGTKAAVEVLKTLKEISNKPTLVEWNDGNPKVIKS